MTGRASACKKIVPVVPNGSFPEQLDGKNDGNCQKQIQLEFANRTEILRVFLYTVR